MSRRRIRKSNLYDILRALLGVCLVFVTSSACSLGNTFIHGGSPSTASNKEALVTVPVLDDDPRLGPDDAPVTAVIWSDLTGKYCRKLQPTIAALRARYAGRLRIVWKDSPAEIAGSDAAVIGRAVYVLKGNEAFWKFADEMLGGAGRDPLQLAASLGVSSVSIDGVRAASRKHVDASLAKFWAYGLNGSPSTMIDGELLVGAKPIGSFATIIDAHLVEADLLKAQGKSAREIYTELVRRHFRPSTTDPSVVALDSTVWRVPIDGSPARGPKDALVTLVTFSDFDCEFSNRLQPVLKKIAGTYGDRVRFVYKFFAVPFHTRAAPAGAFAFAARKQKGNDGFWAAYDALFDSAPKLDDASLSAVAKSLGLDVKAAMATANSAAHPAAIDADLALADDVRVDGTPTTFVNGRRIAGATSFEIFARMIDEELASAEKRVAAGTPRKDLYATLIASGKGGPIELPPLVGAAPSRGPADAKVVLHVFGDFDEPFTRRLMFPIAGTDGAIDPDSAPLRRIFEVYPKQVRVVFRSFPLLHHARAEPVAQFALDAFATKGNAAFWPVFEDLLSSAPALADDDLRAIAQKHGLDWAHERQVMFAHTYEAMIDRDLYDAHVLGVVGVPTTYVDGHLIAGVQPFSEYKRRIDRALAK